MSNILTAKLARTIIDIVAEPVERDLRRRR